MPVRLIIFDLDGTLIDSIDDITDALNVVLHPLHVPALDAGEVAGMIGEGALKLVENVFERYGIRGDTEAVARRYSEVYSSRLTRRTTLYPGAREALESLSFCTMAIISNKSEALSRMILDHFGLSKHFSILVGADTIPERKPSPVPLLYVLSAFKMLPGEAIMVGDSEIDVMAGKAASMRTVAITHGYGKHRFEKDADFVITGLSSLPALVRTLGP